MPRGALPAAARLTYLDALRGASMLIVVVWHLTLSWPLFLPLSESTNRAIEWGLASTRWCLAMFFLMAGYFGTLLLRRKGLPGYVWDRTRRIGIPLTVGVLVIVPLAGPIIHHVRPDRETTPAPAHLWFLWYVLVMCAVGIFLARARWIGRASAAMSRLVASPFAVPVLALVNAAVLIGARELHVGASSWLVPRPELLALYGGFFLVGVLLQGTSEGVDTMARRPWFTGAIAVAALVPMVLLDPGSIWLGSSAIAPHTWYWLVLLCVFDWAAVFCLIGVGKRLLRHERPALRYVADASYFIFLMHFPLVPLAIDWATTLSLPFPVAWTLALALLFFGLLAVYELVVRHTIIGRTLNGPRPPRRWGPKLPRPALAGGGRLQNLGRRALRRPAPDQAPTR